MQHSNTTTTNTPGGAALPITSYGIYIPAIPDQKFGAMSSDERERAAHIICANIGYHCFRLRVYHNAHKAARTDTTEGRNERRKRRGEFVAQMVALNVILFDCGDFLSDHLERRDIIRNTAVLGYFVENHTAQTHRDYDRAFGDAFAAVCDVFYDISNEDDDEQELDVASECDWFSRRTDYWR